MRFTPELYTQIRPFEKTDLRHFIRFYPNIIPDKICDDMIIEFDNHKELQIEQKQGNGGFCFQQLNVSANSEQEPWKTLHTILVEAIQEALEQYNTDIDYDSSIVFPQELGLEEIRINCTEPTNSKGFLTHTDVGNYASARRFLTVLFYLNTIEEGGDAYFEALDVSFKPTKGSVLIFPSTWQFPHCGLPSLINRKFICTSFVHYV